MGSWTAMFRAPWAVTGSMISEILREIYEQGVIERHPVLEGKDTGSATGDDRAEYPGRESKSIVIFTPSERAYEHLIAEMGKLKGGSLAALQGLTLHDYLEPNIFYDEQMTAKVRQSSLEDLTLTQGMVQAGQRIISLGELVSGSKFQMIESLRKEYESNPNVGKNYLVVYLGQFLLITLIFLALFWFIYYFRKDIFFSRRSDLLYTWH